MTVSLNYAARSDVGLTRENNQDSGYAGPQLLVVADGMGGAAAGDVASSVAVAHLASLDGDEHSADELLDLLRSAVADAHSDLLAYARDTPKNAGLGTTVIALLRTGATAAMVHIGDSRAYLVRAGTMHQVTHDHTFVQHLVDTGQLTEEEAENHPQRSVLLRVLGDSSAEIELDESVRELRDGDRWLLCSDGLSSYVSAETIADVLAETADPGQCADDLVQLALRAGGQDNITVIVADVTKDATDPGRLPDTTPQVVGAAAVDRKAPTRGGNSPAARAAALTAGSRASSPRQMIRDSSDDEEELDLDAPPRRRPIFTILAIVVVLLMLAGAGTLGYRWTQTQFYVAPDETDGVVAIYRGVPQELGPVSLSSIEERSDIVVAELPPFVQARVEAGIAASSLEAARDTVEGLAAEVSSPETTEPTDDASTAETDPATDPTPSDPSTSTSEATG
ncbi:Stp1/IreP family PP2C-type Ser/Thr phosphatase [Pseudactinotalea suaedae]|uniref:Stp1/IreP family PP2C-type Ser/Thr phosphatase n=1 Tax=Pseudactinotalea suaedae TaxID=1524924 RepID=UPI0012E130B7|nr:Stp1/IreP family PP2C-type Ser/Thr phosphatase [Pseudactinotalea suaedae]